MMVYPIVILAFLSAVYSIPANSELFHEFSDIHLMLFVYYLNVKLNYS